MSKPEGLFSIGEMAAVCRVSIDTLRFYETKALITPAHVDPESGYRYYRRENLLRLRTVLRLKDAGLSLLDIREYLDGKKHTKEKIAELTERRDLLSRVIENLQIRDIKPGDLTVSEIELPERLCLCRMVEARDGAAVLSEIDKFYDELIRSGVPLSRAWPEFCEYPDQGLLKGEFPTTDFTVRACLTIDPKNAPSEGVRYPAGRALVVNFRGGYYDLWKAYAVLSQYIDENGYVPTGYPQEIYLEIESDGSVPLDESNNITRVIIPVKLINE